MRIPHALSLLPMLWPGWLSAHGPGHEPDVTTLPPPVVTPVMVTALPDQPGKEALMLLVEYPPGGGDPVHRHDAHGFVYVLEGTPDVWLDGELHRLAPGDAVGFPAGTGLAHTFINNSGAEVHLLVVGEKHKPENRIVYPLNPESKAGREDWWHDAPARELGPHDGLPDALRSLDGTA